MKITWGQTYWPWYLIVTAIGFLGPEIWALITHSGNTLSNYSRTSLNVTLGEHLSQHNAAWALTLGVFVVVTVWLVGHIWFDWWG
jgi:hypothetical protein